MSDLLANDASTPVRFLLNDIRPEVLARNLLILHAVSEFYDPDEHEDEPLATRVAQLWYSLVLDPDVRTFWEGQMRKCLVKNWVNPSATLRVLNIETQRAIRHCWQSWLNVDWSVETLLEKRTSFIRSHPDPAVRDADPAVTVKDYMERAKARLGDHLTFSRAARVACEAERFAISDAYFVDPAPRASPVVNPTMLLVRVDGTAYYAVDPKLFPFESVDMYLDKSSSLQADLLAEIRRFLSVFTCSIGTNADPADTVSFAVGHAVTLMEELTADPSKRFNVVDTANLQDSVGMLSLLVHGSALLKPGTYPDQQSLLLTYTTKMSSIADSRDEYLAAVTKFPLGAFPALLGLGLLERPGEEHWSNNLQHFAWSVDQIETQRYQYFTFYRLPAPTVPIALEESDLLRNALYQLGAADKLSRFSAQSLISDTLVPKLVANAFASGRLVWSGSTLLSSLVWPEMDSYNPFVASADYALMSGFHTHLHPGHTGPPEPICRIELPVRVNDRTGPVPPPSHLVVEIATGQFSGFFSGVTVELVPDDPRQLLVALYLPQGHVMMMRSRASMIGVYRERFEWQTAAGGPGKPDASSPKVVRELISGDGELVSFLDATVTRVPYDLHSAAFRGIMQSRASVDEVARGWPLPLVPGKDSAVLAAREFKDVHLDRGAVTLFVDGVAQTMRLPANLRVTNVQKSRRQKRVIVILERILVAAHEQCGLSRPATHVGRAVLDKVTSTCMQLAIDRVAALEPTLHVLAQTSDADVIMGATRSVFKLLAKASLITIHCKIAAKNELVALIIPNHIYHVPPVGPGGAATPGAACYFAYDERNLTGGPFDPQVAKLFERIIYSMYGDTDGVAGAVLLNSHKNFVLFLKALVTSVQHDSPVPKTDRRVLREAFEDLHPFLRHLKLLPFFPWAAQFSL
ncbi:hypothetical protein H9P43_003137 [Blastocladiella emersonii ATCC 22665]|nr:hypothetical protein H9P43_003137 [Blastocladiella emersonii ATCC 22665]